MKKTIAALLLAVVAAGAHARGLDDLPASAIRESQITAADSKPFHLVATVLDTKNASDQLHTARIEEWWLSPQTWRRTRALAVDAPPMVWPELHEGTLAGVASNYVCIDGEGRVRETFALNNDHPDIAAAAREQLMRWRFRPPTADGVPAQTETILTFAYDVRQR